MTYSNLCTLLKTFKASSIANLLIPYRSSGSGLSVSLNGVCKDPYTAMEEVTTILFIPDLTDETKVLIKAFQFLEVISIGENWALFSAAFAAKWNTSSGFIFFIILSVFSTSRRSH